MGCGSQIAEFRGAVFCIRGKIECSWILVYSLFLLVVSLHYSLAILLACVATMMIEIRENKSIDSETKRNI